MSDKQFANQFVELWQENFEKMMRSSGDVSQISNVFEEMKKFYEQGQPTSATDGEPHGDGDNAVLIRTLSRRVDELEQKLKDLETKCG